jgi:hypothetical protein
MFRHLLRDLFLFNDYDVFFPSKCVLVTKSPDKKTETEKTNVPSFFKDVTFSLNKWKEEKNNWYFTVSAPDADIRVDEKGVDVSYEYSKETENGSLKKSQQFFMTYPINSKPETIKARRVNDNIIVTVDKKVVEEDTRRKLTIE